MYKISGENIKLIENIMENWTVELAAERKVLSEFKIHRGIFQGDALSPLLFVTVMMPLSTMLRKYTRGHKLHELQDEIK